MFTNILDVAMGGLVSGIPVGTNVLHIFESCVYLYQGHEHVVKYWKGIADLTLFSQKSHHAPVAIYSLVTQENGMCANTPSTPPYQTSIQNSLGLAL